MIYYLEKKLKKRLQALEANTITVKKNDIHLMSLAQRMHFRQDLFQMTPNALVPVIDHCHIKGLHLF